MTKVENNSFLSKIVSFKKNYFSNFSWMMVENLLRIILGLTVSIYIIRYLGPNDYGILSYAVSLTGILSPIATLGIDAILLRDVIRERQQQKILIHTARVLKFCSGILLSFLTVVSVYFFIEDKNVLTIVTILMVGITINSFNVYKEYIVSVNKMKLIAYAGIISLLISNFFKIGLIFIKASVIWFAIAIVIAQLTNLISLRHFYKQISELQNQYFSKRIAKTLLKDSWPLIFTSFTGTLFIYADQILIEFFYNFEKVGLYAAAVKLVLFFTVIPSVLSNMIYPKVIEIHTNNDSNVFLSKMIEIYFYHFLLSVFIISIFFMFGEQFILIFYGENFYDSILILELYSISFIFIFFNPMNNKLLMIYNLQKLMLIRNFIGLFINLVLNYYLIPLFGIVGAVYSTLLSQIVILFSYLFDKRTVYVFEIQIKSILYPLIIIKNFIK